MFISSVCWYLFICVCSLGSANAQTGLGPPVAAFRDQPNGKCGFIDRHGNVVLEPKFDGAGDFEKGLAYVELQGTKGFIDARGRLVVELPADVLWIQRPTEGLIWYRAKEQDRPLWGLLNERGTVVVKPTYRNVKPFSEGLAAVQLPWDIKGDSRGKWGFVNRRGEVVIPFRYEDNGPLGRDSIFTDGVALVKDKTGTKFIDRTGKVILDAGHKRTEAFQEGLGAIHDIIPLEQGFSRTRYFDPNGKLAFTVDGFGQEFHEGFAVVSVIKLEDKKPPFWYGYIDRTGKLLIPTKFRNAAPFSDGLGAVRTDREDTNRDWESMKLQKWGYIDKAGKMAVESRFNEARPFHGGVARVHLGGEFQHVYDAPSFWRGGEWWLIDKNGKKLRRTYLGGCEFDSRNWPLP
jgi:hypothetical protein